MDKQVFYFGKTEQGVFAQSLFGSAGAFEKTAGAPPFADWETGDELRKYIRTISRSDRAKNAYVLVNAMGAGEFFGSNINADYFPWNALSHEGDDYGYKTFYRAHAFQHHANKDPNRAFGVPVLSVLNTGMKRVELIIKLDREKARQEAADGVISRIDKGEFPDVSMGCKVPYDVCSICGQQSKTTFDYCKHMRPPDEMKGIWGPNKILPDGRKIYVLNTFPRFFDISFVFIGADKTAKVMAKLASRGSQVCIGSVCAIPAADGAAGPALYGSNGTPLDYRSFGKEASACDEMRGPCGKKCSECAERDSCHTTKLAAAFGVKTAEHRKLSEIVKQVPGGAFAMKRLPAMEGAEPDLPDSVLEHMARHRIADSLGASDAAGMVLKPREFQRIVLIRMGERDMADDLDNSNQVFRHVPYFDTSVRSELHSIARLLRLLIPFVATRSAFGESFRKRMLEAGEGSTKKTLPTPEQVKHPVLDKISAAYNGYRRQQMMKLSQVAEVIQGDPQLRDAILGNNFLNMFAKTATAQIISPDSIPYLMGAHLTDRDLLCSNPAVVDAAAEYQTCAPMVGAYSA